jgi:hypothetical protein
MDLQSQAENEGPRRTSSKLEPHREAIFALRRKHWTHRQIAQWLNEHGVKITLSAVHRFCQRAIARRPRSAGPLPMEVDDPISVSVTPPVKITKTSTTETTNPYQFNINI